MGPWSICFRCWGQKKGSERTCRYCIWIDWFYIALSPTRWNLRYKPRTTSSKSLPTAPSSLLLPFIWQQNVLLTSAQSVHQVYYRAPSLISVLPVSGVAGPDRLLLNGQSVFFNNMHLLEYDLGKRVDVESTMKKAWEATSLETAKSSLALEFCFCTFCCLCRQKRSQDGLNVETSKARGDDDGCPPARCFRRVRNRGGEGE